MGNIVENHAKVRERNAGQRLSAIAIMGRDYGIGKEGGLLWNLPTDMRYFKETTVNHPIIMGRLTHESIGRPLSRRTNIVMTRNETAGEGVEIARTMDEALEIAGKVAADEVFVIGGGRVYAEFLPLLDRLYLSVVNEGVEADTFFPRFDAGAFETVSQERMMGDTLPYTRMVLERKARI